MSVKTSYHVPNPEESIQGGKLSRPVLENEDPAMLPTGSALLPPRTTLAGTPISYQDDTQGHQIWSTSKLEEDEQPTEYSWYEKLWQWASENSTALVFGGIAIFIVNASMNGM
jgi:hypothetical protein